jgi:hypothetical protein
MKSGYMKDSNSCSQYAINGVGITKICEWYAMYSNGTFLKCIFPTYMYICPIGCLYNSNYKPKFVFM